MQIFLRPVVDPGSGLTEWAILELQGDLESRDLAGLKGFVGDLHYTKDNTPILIIGHHILYGKAQRLEKPLAVMKKTLNPRGTTEYLINAVIRRKIVFKERPKPIVSLKKVV